MKYGEKRGAHGTEAIVTGVQKRRWGGPAKKEESQERSRAAEAKAGPSESQRGRLGGPKALHEKEVPADPDKTRLALLPGLPGWYC